jgi:hypothetical protein
MQLEAAAPSYCRQYGLLIERFEKADYLKTASRG